jgi:hypothetical protein
MINDRINLFNELFEFRNEYDMEEDFILDVIEEYAHKHNLDPEYIAQELSDYKIFTDIVEKECIKHKYLRKEYQADIGNLNDWER